MAPLFDSDTVAARLGKLVLDGEPGLAVGVYRGSSLIASAAAGLANLEHDTALGDDTVFEVASTTKMFTSTVVLLLARDGLLSLDDRLDAYLPMRLRHPVTLRQCLQHTAGLPDFVNLAYLVGGASDAFRKEEPSLRLLASLVEGDFVPGTEWAYSNSGYLAAVAVVRAVTGRSMAEAARERLFDPLGMHRSRFNDDIGVVVPGRAAGYVKAGDAFRRLDVPFELVGPGGLNTTIADLARWHGFLADGDVLGADIRDALFERTVLDDGTVRSYGLGIMHGELRGRPTVAHGGSTEGYRSHLAHLPADGIGIAVLSNRTDLDLVGVASAVLGDALDLPEPAPPATPAPVAPGGSAADPVGLWHDPGTDQCLHVRRTEDGLQVVVGLAVLRLEANGPDRWRPAGVGGVELHLDGDRLSLLYTVQAEAAAVYQRVQPAQGTPPIGVFLSPELGALATVSVADDGTPRVQIGVAPPVPLAAGPEDVWVAPGFAVRAAGDAIFVSSARFRRIRFDRVADGTQPMGFPVSLGGPVPLPG